MTESVQWIKWRFDKWRGDAGLRMCGIAARGLWIELLSIMHECDPYGYLMIKGRQPTMKQLASIIGMTNEKEVSTLLAELEEAGVFSRNEDGVIFSRRMQRDNQAREVGKANGAQGGNPQLRKNSPKGVNPLVNQGDNQTPKNGVKTESESEKESEGDKPRASHFESLDGVETEEGTGRQHCGGYYLDITTRRVYDAARIDNARWTGRADHLLRWLKDGILPDTIVAAISQCAERKDYSVPATLKYFDKPVREAHGKQPVPLFGRR